MEDKKLLDTYSTIIAKDIVDYTKDDQYVLAQEYSKIGMEKSKITYKKAQIEQDLGNYKKVRELELRAEVETTTDAKGNEKQKNKYTEQEAKNIVGSDEKVVEYNADIALKQYEIDTLLVVMKTIEMIQPIARETIGTTGYNQD